MADTSERQRQERDSATRRLLVAYRDDGDARARDRLVELYLPLVDALARRYRGPRAEYDDLCQAGSIGLLNAIERFDPGRGGEFAAFAVPTVAGEMKRHIRDRTATVRLPRRLQDAAAQLPSKREELSGRLGRTPTGDELAAALGVDPVDVASLEQPVVTAASDEHPGADPGLALADERLLLAGAFEVLDEEEREIVLLRFVEEVDRKDVASRLGMSESRLGRRSRTALAKLRRELEEGALPTAPGDPREDRPAEPDPPAPAPAPKAAPAKSAGGSGHSGRLLLRMPRPLHDDLADAAEREGVSLNRFITGILTAAVTGTGGDPEAPERQGERDLDVREVPRWLPAAIVANIVIVALAAVAAIVLLVLALANGW